MPALRLSHLALLLFAGLVLAGCGRRAPTQSDLVAAIAKTLPAGVAVDVTKVQLTKAGQYDGTTLPENSWLADVVVTFRADEPLCVYVNVTSVVTEMMPMAPFWNDPDPDIKAIRDAMQATVAWANRGNSYLSALPPISPFIKKVASAGDTVPGTARVLARASPAGWEMRVLAMEPANHPFGGGQPRTRLPAGVPDLGSDEQRASVSARLKFLKEHDASVKRQERATGGGVDMRIFGGGK
jgi:hypothetical protein